jgi:hypothetical protein
MSEWWTYTLSDFLLFSPRTYYRLFELYNAEIWPAQLVTLALGVVILVLLWHGGARQGRLIAAGLAGSWLFVAWAFHFNRYATINWAAIYVAAGFAIEALLLLAVVIRGTIHFDRKSRAGLGIVLVALLAQPLIGPTLGRPWAQIELFGAAPDPTATVTLAVLLFVRGRFYWLLAAIPAMWCVLSGATLWTMDAPDALVTPTLALVTFLLRLMHRRAEREPISRTAWRP